MNHMAIHSYWVAVHGSDMDGQYRHNGVLKSVSLTSSNVTLYFIMHAMCIIK